MKRIRALNALLRERLAPFFDQPLPQQPLRWFDNASTASDTTVATATAAISNTQ